ncbi:PepSY-associated TM helix domain-containing protein [Pseudoalteromonas tunicata]|uniref:PepSY-associated TM helix domain-containing protein n=1 Tax=Pseudoalteromonas tunicata TaxID=314281 RepID=UPI00273F96F3|nr:PepSY-associated TM helix domain-containing protein [Pseudoalteromonas tunicata]MDP4983792.1 PepSY domain-containing protein [Pseudoalteromonas tunicata]
MKIPSPILRTYQNLHSWTGIIAGLFLFIGFFAGALTMFKEPIDSWSSPPELTLSHPQTTNYDHLIDLATSQFPAVIKGFTLDLNPSHSPLTWYESGNARELGLNDSIRHASLDPQGQLISVLETPNELANLIDYLHQSAGIPGELGHHLVGGYIVGFAALIYFLALVSGFIFLLPTLTKSFFALRKNKGPSRFWLDSHNLLGITSFPFHIIIALTAVVFAFHDFFYAGLSLIYGEVALFERSSAAAVAYQIDALPNISEHINAAQAYVSGYQVQTISFFGLNTTTPFATLTLLNEHEMMRGPLYDYLYMNPYTLEITGSTLTPGNEGIWSRIVASFFALHFGSYGGQWVRWVYFILGLGGAALFYTGNLLWLEKRRNKHSIEQSKSYTRMAALTVGVCLGCIAGVMAAILITKWATSSVLKVNEIYVWVYYTTFLAALGYAFWQGAAKAAIHLLNLIILLCLLIPITSLGTALLLPTPWFNTHDQAWYVELIAVLFAGIAYFGQQKVKQRAHHGEQNSIWFIASPAVKQRISAQNLEANS